ncbi:MAG: hypothetical protein ACI9HK_005116 [Pirellulaceae bacterium]|jgi:hypothetical protein
MEVSSLAVQQRRVCETILQRELRCYQRSQLFHSSATALAALRQTTALLWNRPSHWQLSTAATGVSCRNAKSFLHLFTLTTGALWSFASHQQQLKVIVALAASVFINRHGFELGFDFRRWKNALW